MVVGDFVRETQLVVIGLGPAGCAAALRAATHGLDTIVIEVPDALNTVGGLPLGHEELESLRSVIRDKDLETITGRPSFASARELVVRNGTLVRLRFKRAIIAAGRLCAPPPDAWPDTPLITHDIFRTDEPENPETLLVVGGDAMSVGVATDFARRGTSVTLVTGEEFIPEADETLLGPLRVQLQATLESVRRGPIESVEANDGTLDVFFGNNEMASFDRIIVAEGPRPYTEPLMPAHAQVDLEESGAVIVDERLRTSNQRIFAAGPVTGGPDLWHGSWLQGEIAADGVAGIERVFDAAHRPTIIRSDPPLAWCGLTERAAITRSIPHRILEASPRGRGPTPAAMARLISDPESGLILGVGLAGPGAAETIGEATLALEMGALVDDLAATVRSDTALSALLTEAAASAQDDKL